MPAFFRCIAALLQGFLGLLLLGAVPQSLTFAADAVWPHSGELHYVVQRADDPVVLGRVQVSWHHDGLRYALRSVSETAGLLAALKPARTVQESQGDMGAEGLRPLSFSYEKKRGTDSVVFDWPAGVLRFRDQQLTLPLGTQDLLSLHGQLAQRAWREGVRDISVATGSKLMTYRVESVGEERLTLGTKSYNSLHLYATSGNERMDFWVPVAAKANRGADAFSLPLRIRMTDKNGVAIDQSLDAADPAH